MIPAAGNFRGTCHEQKEFASCFCFVHMYHRLDDAMIVSIAALSTNLDDTS